MRGCLLVIIVIVTHVNACTDFLVFLNKGRTQRSAEATRELALSLATQLELDQRVHRVALVSGTDEYERTIDFERIQTRVDYLHAIQEWTPASLSSTSKGLELRLERALRQATAQRRMNTALTVILIDDDGSSAFNTNPANFGLFSEFIRKKHYVYILIASRKPERIRTSLDLTENEVETGSNRDELRLIASPFTRCQIREANAARELRRKPLPRLNPHLTPQDATSENNTDRPSTLIDSLSITVPVSVHFSTTTRPSTTTSQSTTSKTTLSVSPITSKPRKTECQFDIVILYDLSGNSLNKLERYQQMSLDLIRQSELGTHAARFALIRYSGPKREDVVFHLSKHSTPGSLIEEIENVQPMGGTTRTAEALRYALREFEPKHGGRDLNEVQRHMIVFTDGHSQDDPSEVAAELSRERVHVFAVAVEDSNVQPDLEQLRLIATDEQSTLLDAQFGKVIERLAPKRCQF